MNQNQCVPNWDLDDVGSIPPPPTKPITSRSHPASHSAAHDTSMLDYEMAELTWENGQLTMHGLGVPRVPSKNNLGGAWTDKSSARAGGTLESIVSQATQKSALPLTPTGACEYDDTLVPLFYKSSNVVQCTSAPASVSMGMDALVPTNNNDDKGASKPIGGCSTRVGSCSVATARVPSNSDRSVSVWGGSDRWQSLKRPADDTREQLRSISTNGITSTSFGASFDTRTITIDDHDHDSACHSKPQDEEENDKKGIRKSTSSTKRSRAAAVHNQSERKRRDKINQRMKTLQKLVPNSNKTDKASMLDEVIDYLKQLQAQVQMVNAMRLPSTMMPVAMQQQQLPMSMMGPMAGMGVGMGMGLGIGMGGAVDQMNIGMNAAMARPPNFTGLPSPAVVNPIALMSLAASDGGDRLAMPQPPLPHANPLLTSYLTCQPNPVTTMDAYTVMASMYQQLQQLQQSQHQQPGPSSNT